MIDRSGIDLLDPAFLADPYPVYARWRSETPILYDSQTDLWYFTRYADISSLLRDRRLGRAFPGHAPRQSRIKDPTPFGWLHNHMLMEMEPPDHTRLRSLVNKVFTPVRVEALRPRIQDIANELVEAVIDTGTMDLLRDFAEPLPVIVIAELLGVPESDRKYLRPWSHDIVAMYELSPTSEDARKANAAVTEFAGYLRGLASERRQHSRADLISDLVQVQDKEDRLSEDELVATGILLLNAGHEATVNAIANGMLALFRNPEAQSLLQGQASRKPGLLRTAVEEMLRYDTPLQLFKRWVLEDISIQDTVLQSGARLALLYGSANRDERRFSDADRFDISRRENPHLTFGAGTHYCLGAPLARVEMRIAVSTLLTRLPGLRLASEKLEYRPTYVIRGLKELPVEWNMGA